MNDYTSGESQNDSTIIEPQEGDDFRNCEDDAAKCGEYVGEGA